MRSFWQTMCRVYFARFWRHVWPQRFCKFLAGWKYFSRKKSHHVSRPTIGYLWAKYKEFWFFIMCHLFSISLGLSGPLTPNQSFFFLRSMISSHVVMMTFFSWFQPSSTRIGWWALLKMGLDMLLKVIASCKVSQGFDVGLNKMIICYYSPPSLQQEFSFTCFLKTDSAMLHSTIGACSLCYENI